MKKFTLILLLLCTGPLLFAQDFSRQWSLEECVQYALRQNLQIKNSSFNLENAQIGLDQARLNRLPNITAGASAGNRYGRSIDPTTNLFVDTRVGNINMQAGSNVILFQGGQLTNAINQNKMQVLAAQNNMEAVEFQVSTTVATNYLNVLFAKAQLENAEIQLRITQDQLEQTIKQVNAGALPVANRLDLEAQLANDELALVTAENQLTIALLGLKQIMLLEADVPLDIVEPQIDLDALQINLMNPGEVYKVAETNQPGVRSADFNLQAAEYGIRSARGALYPTLLLGYNAFTKYSDVRGFTFVPDGTFSTVLAPVGFVSTTGDVVVREQQIPGGEMINYVPARQFRDNISQSLNLSLNVPVFNRFVSRNNLARAKIQKEQAEIQSLEARQTLRQSIESAYTDAVAASKAYQANLRRVSSLEEAFRATESRLNAGGANPVEYQIASNNLFRARNDLIRAKYEFIFRTKLLEFFMGKPLTLN